MIMTIFNVMLIKTISIGGGIYWGGQPQSSILTFLEGLTLQKRVTWQVCDIQQP